VRLSQWNFGTATTFYPLGSCTMKYNPLTNEVVARLPGFAALHPMTPDACAQGALQLCWELQDMLAEVSGMDAVSLQPAAGAHGELTGMKMIRAHADRRPRQTVLIPPARMAPSQRRAHRLSGPSMKESAGDQRGGRGVAMDD
jgi:glycine dehydrogenase subunit 2